MSKSSFQAAGVPEPAGAYSHAVRAGGLVFTAGLGPQDPVTGAIPDGVAEQTRQVMRNLRAVLESAGLTLDDVVKTTVHLQHLDRDFAEFDAAYRDCLTPPYPVRTTVGSTLAGILVEIDMVAVA